jgi:hypothetical protein
MSIVVVYNYIMKDEYTAALKEAQWITSVPDDCHYPQWAYNQLQHKKRKGLTEGDKGVVTRLESKLETLDVSLAKGDVQTKHRPSKQLAGHSRRGLPAFDSGTTFSLNGTDLTPVMGPETDGADACSRLWGSMPRDSIPSGSITISTGPGLDI